MLSYISVNTLLYIYCKANHGELAEEFEKDRVALLLDDGKMFVQSYGVINKTMRYNASKVIFMARCHYQYEKPSLDRGFLRGCLRDGKKTGLD
ncbi:hypothetical protein E2542_SST15990 [Spatholobus suberectus]|nr:hypothetical protein E2542_SST15990 [Spatholobus suberectus]